MEPKDRSELSEDKLISGVSSVSVVNNIGVSISPIQKIGFEFSTPKKSSHFRINNSDDFVKTAASLLLLVAFLFSDTYFLTFFQKLWCLLVSWLVSLLYEDYRRYKRSFNRDFNPFQTDTVNMFDPPMRTTDLIHDYVLLEDCNLSINSVKIIDPILEAASNNFNPRPGSFLLFKIDVSTKTRRWAVWRSYEDIFQLSQIIISKYPSERVPKFRTYFQMYRQYKREVTSSGMSTITSFKTLSEEEDFGELILDQIFLQSLQMEITNWIMLLRKNSSISDDDNLRALLQLAPLSITRANSLTNLIAASYDSPVKTHFAPMQTTVALTMEPSTPIILSEPLTPPTPIPSQSTTATTPHVSKVASPMKENNFVGNRIDNIEFTDIPDSLKSMALDCSFSHGFKVRDRNYMVDRKKIEASPALAKFICLDLFRVDRSIYGDRHDHISRMRKVQSRIQTINSLQDNPFVLVVNIQIPGDPPVSMVSYFALPSNFHPDLESSKDLQNAKSLFERFIDIPLSEESCEDPVASPDMSTPSKGVPRLPRQSLMAVTPQKSWGADIAWGNVGEPGILDRKSFQNMRFKLIPQMIESPWVLQMAVSSTPCLLGTKLVLRYFRGVKYMEVDLHVGSSSIACNVVSLCRKYSKLFTCNIGIVIQGEKEEELPEKVLACYTISKIDLDTAISLDD